MHCTLTPVLQQFVPTIANYNVQLLSLCAYVGVVVLLKCYGIIFKDE